MGKSIVVPGGNFKNLRAGIIGQLIPQKLSGLINLFLASKYVDNVWMNTLNEKDLLKPANELSRIYNFPTLETSSVLNNKQALLFQRITTSAGSYLRGPCYLGESWSIHLCYVNNNLSAGGAVFSLNNGHEFFRFLTVRGNGTAGISCAGLAEVIELFPATTAREIVSIQKEGNKLIVFRDGIKIENEFDVPSFTPFITISIGGYDNLNQSAQLTPFTGYLGYISSYASALSDEEVMSLHAQLEAYY